jgi:hypothetical protein
MEVKTRLEEKKEETSLKSMVSLDSLRMSLPFFCHLPLPCKGLTTKQQKISVHPKNYVFVLVSLSALGVFGVFLCVK